MSPVCLCLCMHVSVWAPVCSCMSKPEVSVCSSIAHHLMFWAWPWSFVNSPRLATQQVLGDTFDLVFTCDEMTGLCCYKWLLYFSLDSRGRKAGLHACIPSTLPSEPSPQPDQCFFKHLPKKWVVHLIPYQQGTSETGRNAQRSAGYSFKIMAREVTRTTVH